MARRIQVPEGEEGTLRFIAGLSDADFENLKAAFSEATPTLYTSRFTKRVLDRTGHSDEETWSDAVKSITAIVNAVDYFGTTASRAASDLAAELQAKSLLEADDSTKLRHRLEILLSLQSVEISVQADKALMGRGNLFSSASINTQVQPLFTTEDGELSFSTALLSHELQIQVYETPERNSVVRAILDDTDLYALRTEINRAIAKREVIRSAITNSSISFLQDGIPKEGGADNED